MNWAAVTLFPEERRKALWSTPTFATKEEEEEEEAKDFQSCSDVSTKMAKLSATMVSSIVMIDRSVIPLCTSWKKSKT